MLKKYILSLCLLTLLYSGASLAHIEYGKCHDYRTQHSAELQKMQDFHLQQAKTKMHNQQLAYAWGDLAYLLCHVPNHHEALQHMLTLAPQLHKELEIHDYLTTALDLFPEDPVLHIIYSGFLFNIGANKDAEKHLQLAQQLEPRASKQILREKKLTSRP